MSGRIGRAVGSVFTALSAVVGCFFLYAVFVWTPVSLWAEAKCLSRGYPKTNVTIGLQVYCLNLDGTVTVRVEKLP
jgi:hypothetical protein